MTYQAEEPATTAKAYFDPLISQLESAADPVKASEMNRYMRDRFTFLGVARPERTAIFRSHLTRFGLPGPLLHDEVILRLWNDDPRELQYLALDILFRTERQAPPERIDLYEALVATRSWWDTVDMVAQKLIGPHFRRHGEQRHGYFDSWRRSDNLWLNRTAILFQNRYREQTDFSLLESLAAEFASSDEFFIRKAIGWALREYAKVDAPSVIAVTESLPLSALTKREALRHVKK